jgi:hypothetical protein
MLNTQTCWRNPVKQQISPAAAGVVIAIVVAVVAFFLYRGTAGVSKSQEPRDMKRMMNPQQMAPPANAGRNTGSGMGMPGTYGGTGGR